MIDNVSAGEIIQPDWGNSVADWINGAVEQGVDAVGVSGMAIGTGGSAQSNAWWTYVGGPDVGDVGILNVIGNITFGTTGAAFPGSSALVNLPPGFTMPVVNPLRSVGHCDFAAVSTTFLGVVKPQSATTLRFICYLANGTYVQASGTGSTIPGAWAAGDSILYQYTTKVERA